MKVRDCNGCRFCCWSFNVHDVPDKIQGIQMKPALQNCQYECSLGCSIHKDENYPPSCKDFFCPYLEGKDIYRPDTFQPILEELNGNMSNYIPTIPLNIPIEKAKNLIQKTRNIVASIIVGNEWVDIILPLDRNEDRSWTSNEDAVKQWRELYNEKN